MFNYLEKENKKLSEISNNFSSNDMICKQMLEILNNKTTNLKLDKDIKNSYYVFLNDTIYLSDREQNKTSYLRICTVSHECIHSIQNKIIQVVNFVLSNIEIVAFIIAFICMICRFNTNIIFYSYLVLNLLSAIPRLILEIDATIRSSDLSKIYIKSKIDENDSNILISAYRNKIGNFFPVFIMSLLMGRILRLLFIYILK